jgi:hypothetical protein
VQVRTPFDVVVSHFRRDVKEEAVVAPRLGAAAAAKEDDGAKLEQHGAAAAAARSRNAVAARRRPTTRARKEEEDEWEWDMTGLCAKTHREDEGLLWAGRGVYIFRSACRNAVASKLERLGAVRRRREEEVEVVSDNANDYFALCVVPQFCLCSMQQKRVEIIEQ